MRTSGGAFWPPGASDEASLRALVEVAADGLAVLDEDSRILSLNAAAAQLLGGPAADLVGRPAPFRCSDSALATQVDRRRTMWVTPNGRRRDLEYRFTRLAGGRFAAWFSDVTDVVRQQERLTAITRAASSVADTYSMRVTLDAVANEIRKTANIAAVQILAINDPHEELRVLGMAGLGEADDFTERLSACRRLGARVRFQDAFENGRPVVVLHRKPAIMADPAWAPLHEVMDRPDWDSFASVPMVVRRRALGVINAFYVPGDDPGPRSVHFLEVMADHAAVAIDTAQLLAQTRAQAQSDERRRLARDLHDSVVQQVFSMRMQAQALRAHVERDLDTERVRGVAEELAELAESALTDLRGLVFELRPLDLAERGLIEAVRAHAAALEARVGLRVDVHTPADLVLDAGLAVEEDLYRIVQEALHNVVKHAHASRVDIRFTVPQDSGDGLVIEVSDNGPGHDPATAGPASEHLSQQSLGLVSMHERIERWGGSVVAGARATGGWTVEVTLPTHAGRRAEPGRRPADD